jgi:phosphohistidine swiveling domain-containing protein
MTQYIKSLHNIGQEDFPLAGGKGANLGEMIQAGLHIPPGFVILTSAYHDFVERNDLQKDIDTITHSLRADDMVALEEASTTIYNLFEKKTIPEEIYSEIAASYSQLKKSVVVRSSATAEDLPGISFAGQYNTYLNITMADEVCQAVRRCWASLWNARAISYRLNQGIPHENLKIAVIVQEFINGEKAGILFTANPLNGRRDQMVINASWGLGEAIVGGQVSPDQWIIQKESYTPVETHISRKDVMTKSIEEGTSTEETPQELQEKPVLTQEDIEILCKEAQKTESYFNFPQDIEWVYAEGTFYLVQTRPITSLFPLPQPEPDPEDGLRIYASLNIAGQGITEPLTPMGLEAFRLLYYGFSRIVWGDRALKYPKWVPISAGRMYLDLTSLLGTRIGNQLFEGIAKKDPDLEPGLNQLMKKYGNQIPKGKRPPIAWLLKLIPSLGGLILRTLVFPQEGGQKIVVDAEEEIETLKKAASTLQGMEERLRFIEEASVGVMKMMVREAVVFSLGYAAIDRAESLVEEWLGDKTVLEPVMQSLPYNPTTDMSMRLLEIAQKLKDKRSEPSLNNEEIQNFLTEFGHRAVLEIDMGLLRWREDPSYVIEILNLYKEGNPSEKIEKFQKGAEKAEDAVINIVSQVRERKGVVHAWVLSHLLRSFRGLAGLRERPKFDLVRSLDIFRSILQDVGRELVSQGRLNQINDIFFVTFSDIESGSPLNPIVEKNRNEYNRELKRNVVPRLMTSTGESIYTVIEETGDKLQGIPVSPGVYEGIVRVIFHPKGAHLEPGEILVTRSTDPAWTPLFINAGALIMETGGPVSHGSIVAREYGIPAVANVPEATTRLETGQRIRVNGVSGEVVLLD